MRRTPLEAYQARPKALPAGTKLDDAGWRVRHDTADPWGSDTTAVSTTSGSAAATPTPVLILAKDVHVRITAPNGEVLRDFHLDPSRDYQPQPKK